MGAPVFFRQPLLWGSPVTRILCAAFTAKTSAPRCRRPSMSTVGQQNAQQAWSTPQPPARTTPSKRPGGRNARTAGAAAAASNSAPPQTGAASGWRLLRRLSPPAGNNSTDGGDDRLHTPGGARGSAARVVPATSPIVRFARAKRWKWNASSYSGKRRAATSSRRGSTTGGGGGKGQGVLQSAVHDEVDSVLGTIDPAVFQVKVMSELGRQKNTQFLATHGAAGDHKGAGHRGSVHRHHHHHHRRGSASVHRSSLVPGSRLGSPATSHGTLLFLQTVVGKPPDGPEKLGDGAANAGSGADPESRAGTRDSTVSSVPEDEHFQRSLTPEVDEEYAHQIESFGLLLPTQQLYEGDLALSEFFDRYRRTKVGHKVGAKITRTATGAVQSSSPPWRLPKRTGAASGYDSDSSDSSSSDSGSDRRDPHEPSANTSRPDKKGPTYARNKYLESCAREFACPEPLGIVRHKPVRPTDGRSSSKSNVVNLSHFGMGELKSRRLAGPLSELRFVDTLRLRGNRLGDIGSVRICKRLGKWVCHLDLANNAIGTHGGAVLGALLSAPKCCLQTLCLEGNDLGDEGVTPIAQALATNRSLRRLCLRGNDIGSDGCSAIAVGLSAPLAEHKYMIRKAKKAEEANKWAHVDAAVDCGQRAAVAERPLGANKDDGTANDAEAEFTRTDSNDTLEELDLSWNRVCGKGAADLMRALMHFQFWFSDFDDGDAIEGEGEGEEAEPVKKVSKKSKKDPKNDHHPHHHHHHHHPKAMEPCSIQDLDLSWNLIGEDKDRHKLAIKQMLAQKAEARASRNLDKNKTSSGRGKSTKDQNVQKPPAADAGNHQVRHAGLIVFLRALFAAGMSCVHSLPVSSVPFPAFSASQTPLLQRGCLGAHAPR